MAAYDLEEQEQLAELKAWWKQNGNLLVNALDFSPPGSRIAHAPAFSMI